MLTASPAGSGVRAEAAVSHAHTAVPYAALSLQAVRAIDRYENTPRSDPCTAGALVHAALCPCALAPCARYVQHTLEDGLDYTSSLVAATTHAVCNPFS
jgi:hypothetical protein